MGFFGWLFFRSKCAKYRRAALSSAHGSECACCIHWVVAKPQQVTCWHTHEKVPVLAVLWDVYMPAEWVSTRPGPSKSFITSILNAEEELTWHGDLILALAEYHVSRLAYVIFLRVADVGGSLKGWDTVWNWRRMASVGSKMNPGSWRREWRSQTWSWWGSQETCKLGKSISEPEVSLASQIQG